MQRNRRGYAEHNLNAKEPQRASRTWLNRKEHKETAEGTKKSQRSIRAAKFTKFLIKRIGKNKKGDIAAAS